MERPLSSTNHDEQSSISIERSSGELEELQEPSVDMTALMETIHQFIYEINRNSPFDTSFIISILDEDIRANLHIYRHREGNNNRLLVEIDRFNGLYVPISVFLDIVIPMYISIQARTAFTGMTSIRDILDNMAEMFQDELERITVAVSEEEFKEAAFNKKDMTQSELNASISACVKRIISNHSPLDECPLCGKEHIQTYYECDECHYKYCDKCCEEIASRQALCPCCREKLNLIHYNQ